MRPPVPDLSGRRCFVTGAASGIGRATALAAARRGADLYLTDIAAEGLWETADMVRSSGGRVSWAGTADVSDHPAVVAMAEGIHAAHGSMDVVMNVAGISIWGAIENLDHDHWRRANEIDLMGPISVLECFVPPMIEAGRGGHVVNVSSSAGLRGLSEVLRFDLRRHRSGGWLESSPA
jgi:NAD(P)-dependent dehydrogenase (short-subunit alcohol dehydrogenase family)